MTGKNLLVVMGAGASHDVAGAGTDFVNRDLQPPLASGLFTARLSAQILQRYPGAATLAQRIAGRGGIDLEDTLLGYANHPNVDVRNLFKEIPPYLRDLLALSSWQYVRYPSSYSSFIVAAAGETQHSITVVTLNYDRLLEQALVLYNSHVYEFSELSHYCDTDRGVRIVKAHGSVDWLRPIVAANSWLDSVRDLDLSKPYDHGDVYVYANPQPTADITRSQYHWYPVLTAPLASKNASHLVCPPEHIEHLREFASRADKLLFIGTSGFDTDVLSVIHEALPADWNGLVQHVGHAQGLNLMESIDRIESAIPQARRRRNMQGAKPWDFPMGFSTYTHSDEMMEFLEH